MRACEREAGQVVIQRSALPAARPVTLVAVLTKLPTVPVVCLVAGIAILRRAAILTAGVTLHAADLPVPPGECVGSRVVIEAGSLPATGPVTLIAVLAKLPAVPIVCLVAGIAVLRRAAILAVGMALLAGGLTMHPGERIRGQSVVEADRQPAPGRVALRASLTQLPVVLVVCLMASVAALGSAAVLILKVTFHAGCLFVFSSQRIRCGAVGERGTLPAAGGVAFYAVPA